MTDAVTQTVWKTPEATDSGFHANDKPTKFQPLDSPPRLSCRWCNFTCASRTALNSHVLKHVESYPFYCSYCNFRACSLSQLSKHVAQHTSPSAETVVPSKVDKLSTLVARTPSRPDPTVDDSFLYDKPLDAWKRWKPPEFYSCSICGFEASQISDIIPHIKAHTLDSCKMTDNDGRIARHDFDRACRENVHSCTLCDFSSGDLAALLVHVQGHTKAKEQSDDDTCDVGIDRNMFSCNECEYRCVFPNKLAEHMRVHRPGVIFKCTFCDFTSPNHTDMKNHKKNHGSDKPYACETCDARFTRLDNLKTHALVHSNEWSFACEKCDYKCPSKNRLKAHLKLHDKGRFIPRTRTTTSAKCLLCSALFSTVRHLQSHLRNHVSRHLAVNPPKTPMTEAEKAERSQKLYQLLRNQAIFFCPHCPFNTKREVALTTHIRSHTGERPFKCDICKTTFAVKTHLVRHQRVHTGEKPFACHLCDARFAQSGNRKSHLEKVHGEAVEKRSRKIVAKEIQSESQDSVLFLLEKECEGDLSEWPQIKVDLAEGLSAENREK